MMATLSTKAKVVLLNLADEKILTFRRSPQGYFKISGASDPAWSIFHRKTLLHAIHTLYRQEFATIVEGLDGVTVIAVTKAGKQYALRVKHEIQVVQKPQEWDKKWRLVLFDVPETKKKFREAFRYHLRRTGFVEFQRSAFLFPFSCAETIDALAERFNIKEHVVMITAESVSNEFHFKKIFGLL